MARYDVCWRQQINVMRYSTCTSLILTQKSKTGSYHGRRNKLRGGLAVLQTADSLVGLVSRAARIATPISCAISMDGIAIRFGYFTAVNK
jgi:hypothetical protein